MNKNDNKVLALTGLILGVGIWLFPRTTAFLGSCAIIAMAADQIEKKESEASAAA